jgi:hypothetical protein
MTALNPPRATLSLRRPTDAAATLARASRAHTIPIPPGGCLSTAPLKAIEHYVLMLIDLDPRLATREHRPRLYVTLALFPPRRSHQRVGHAMARSRDLVAAGAVHTQAFVAQSDHVSPSRTACERLFAVLLDASIARDETTEVMRQRKVKFLRMFGYLATAQNVDDASQPGPEAVASAALTPTTSPSRLLASDLSSKGGL